MGIQHYTYGLNYDPSNAIILSNRAMAYIKKKNWKAALIDANKAIEIDSSYLKGYFRRAKANAEMKNYKESAKDYKYLKNKLPEDKDVKRELDAIMKKLSDAEKEELEFEIIESKEQSQKTTPEAAKGFKRIEIEEDSEDE